MAVSRIPGPMGTSGLPQDLNDGTMIRALSPLPGPISMVPGPVAASSHLDSSTFISPKPVSRTTAAVHPLLRQGSRGPEVERLQRLINLRSQPSPGLKLDGAFGPLTLQALQQYQRGVLIPEDGMAGKKTWFHLLKGDTATLGGLKLEAQHPIELTA